jgi:hypothetical protein
LTLPLMTTLPGASFWLEVGPMRDLISEAMVRKACSTLVAFLALVSRKGMPSESANSYGAVRGGWRGSGGQTLAVV